MKRTYLLKHYPEMFQALNSNGTTCILELKVVWFWGLFTNYKEIKYSIPDHHSYKKYTDNWDNLIKNQLPLK